MNTKSITTIDKINTNSTTSDLFVHIFQNSEILDKILEIILLDLAPISPSSMWTLIYRASRDGFKADDFHLKCDESEKTITFIKTNELYVFGGYTNAKWNSIEEGKTDPDAYLVSIVNEENNPILIKIKSNDSLAIQTGPDIGPSFGLTDFQISSDSNLNKNSFSNLGDSYDFQLYSFESDKARKFLAGSYNFIVSEIEMYQLISPKTTKSSELIVQYCDRILRKQFVTISIE